MNVLVINCGSSSLKFSLINESDKNTVLQGMAEKLESDAPAGYIKLAGQSKKRALELAPGAGHAEVMRAIAAALASDELADLKIDAIGHRAVHGAEKFKTATRINEEMIQVLEDCSHLAPLHNPVNLVGIRIAREVFADVPHVAVFDTAFYANIAKQAYLYPIPYEYYTDLGVRRYGFHGTSHKYVYQQAAKLLGKPLEETAIISAHLGNGCSATSSEGGQSVDTTMGLTPLEGLVMGTRSGDVDPSIPAFLAREKGLSIEEIDTIFSKKSGLLGISGISNDMRTLKQAAEEGNERAQLAIDIFDYRLAKSISALRATLSSMDALVFTGGIGENNASTRECTVKRLAHLGISIDPELNVNHGRDTGGRISPEDSPVAVLVIPTDEELMIAEETATVLSA